jgi:ABC-type Fe3+ transport system permease subunit
MGQGQSFCWECGRFNVHHERCVNHPSRNPNPMAQHTPSVPPLALSLNEIDVPPESKQRCTRTCLTIWVSLLCSCGTALLILALVFALQLQRIIDPSAYRAAQQYTIAFAASGTALLVPGIIVAISWCCAFCCCKKRWICGCCKN